MDRDVRIRRANRRISDLNQKIEKRSEVPVCP